jgi:hypothetical protein
LKFFSREPLQLGDIRFSPSSQGFETSIGFEGLSFDCNATGNYTHLGEGGRYYCTAAKPKKHAKSSSTGSDDKKSSTPFTWKDHLTLSQDRKSRCSAVLNVSSCKELLRQMQNKQKRFPFWPFAILASLIPKFGFIILFLLVPLLYFFVDKPRKTTLIYYDITPEVEEVVQQFYRTFNDLAISRSAWHVASEHKVDAIKYNAGASWLVKRKRLKVQYRVPPLLRTNILVPCLFLGDQHLYFLPDQILFQRHSDISSISYSDLKIHQRNIKFVEEQQTASDSKKVGRTWKFVNIDGGPDRRFKYNRELPVLLYSELILKGTSELNVVLQFSKPDVGSNLEMAMRSYPYSDFLIDQIL